MNTIATELTGPAGVLEALLDLPDGEPRAAVVFGHPLPSEGGTMRTRPVHQSAKALARIGCAVLRFNFRGVGSSAGAFEDGPGEMEDFRAALAFMAGRYPGLPLWAAGFSFGGWVAFRVGADDPRVTALVGIAPAVGHYDFEPMMGTTKPKFLVHGDQDPLVTRRMMQPFYAGLQEPKELVVIEGADHVFEGRTIELGEALVDLLGDWPADTGD
ncbi:MAG: alpha/beta hydrolase [Vicinamibacterales bacterium]